ncbi:glycosyltransferase, partial [Limnospira fusiformis]|uniref:glycosyltransferase n=1 Tax=Limnospira fusiformis TaxID=54297 RepID=UPI0034E0AEDE
LSSSEFEGISVDVVVGTNSPHDTEIKKQVAQRPHTMLYRYRPHLADLMAKADIAVGAGGTTTWERLCLGLPTVVVGLADNQIAACQALARDGLIEYLEMVQTVKIGQLRDAISSLAQCPSRLVEMSTQAKLQVDGLGTVRVAEILKTT